MPSDIPGCTLRNEILAMQAKGLGAPFQPINTLKLVPGAVGIDQNPIRAQVTSE
jgi:hypothetical protein